MDIREGGKRIGRTLSIIILMFWPVYLMVVGASWEKVFALPGLAVIGGSAFSPDDLSQ